MRKTRRLILGLVLLLLAAFLLPLVININRYREQIAGALGAGLGRHVQVGSVRLKLLPVPGLVAQNVTVGEGPSFGAEPFARMTELRANLRLRSLWTGRLSFSSLVFVEPSLNLARRKEGAAWNVASLFGPLRSSIQAGALCRDCGRAGARPVSPPPYLEFTDGRINFKDGDTKSVFFFSGVDAAVYQERGSLRIRFRGVPSRTDRRLTGAGEVRVEGELGRFSSTDFALQGPLALRLSLADAFLSDLLALARGAEPGIQGTLGLDLRVSGRPEAPRFEGRIQLGNLRRWDLPPPQEPAPLELVFSGLADLPARRLELAELRTAPGTVTAFGSVKDFLENPQWDLEVRLEGADAGRLFSAVQHFSARLSPGLRVNGRLDGAVHLAGLRASGKVTVKDFSLSGPNLKPLRAPEARLEFSGPMMRLQPVALPLEGVYPLTLGMACDWTSPVEGAQSIEVTAAGSSLPLPSLASLAAALGWPGMAPGVIADGRISLNARLELERGAAPRVTGWATIAKLRWAPAWLAQPVVLQTARLEFSGQQIKVEGLVASAGDSTITGTLRSRRAFDPPTWQAELRVDETGTSALGGMFLSGGTYPKYLARLEVKGKLEVGVFRLRGIVLEELHTGLTVVGGRVVLRDARAALGGGRATGQVKLDFTHAAPQYEAQAQLTGVAAESLPLRLASGPLSGNLEFAATGHGAAEIGDSMRLRGSFTGRDLIVKDAALTEALRQTRVRALTAEVLVLDRRVRFRRLSLRGEGPNEANGEGTDLEATGSVGFDRSLDLDFHTFRLAGTLAAPRRVSPAEVAHLPSR